MKDWDYWKKTFLDKKIRIIKSEHEYLEKYMSSPIERIVYIHLTDEWNGIDNAKLVHQHPIGNLFQFQKDIVRWALKKGKAAIFAGTGLGKTIMQAEWAKQVCNYTNGNVFNLIRKIIRKYDTNCPFTLSNHLNINVWFRDLGQDTREFIIVSCAADTLLSMINSMKHGSDLFVLTN
jgi:hypothetical protein